MQASWPRSLLVVRHGESAGNVARDLAEAQQAERIELTGRDVDVPLSDLGRSQAEALGHHLAALPPDEQPTVLWVSPYARAQQTAEIALRTAGLDLPVVVDERLREREFGVLDGLTRRGITALWPEEAARRASLGKFYHRPPGGESWTDTLLRVRASLADLGRSGPDDRVLLVAHQVVVLLVRYVVEGLTEQQVMAVDAEGDVANCAVTTFARDPEDPTRMHLVTWNDASHLVRQDEPVTTEPDAQAGRR